MNGYFGLPKILKGKNQAYNLPYELARMHCDRPIVVADETLFRIGAGKKLLKAFYNYNMPLTVLRDEKADFKFTLKIAETFDSYRADGVVVLGGDDFISAAAAAKLFVKGGTGDVDYPVSFPVTAVCPCPCDTAAAPIAFVKDCENAKIARYNSRKMTPDCVIIDDGLCEKLPYEGAKACLRATLYSAAAGYGKSAFSDAVFDCAVEIALLQTARLSKGKTDASELIAARLLCGGVSPADGEFFKTYSEAYKTSSQDEAIADKLKTIAAAADFGDIAKYGIVFNGKPVENVEKLIDFLTD